MSSTLQLLTDDLPAPYRAQEAEDLVVGSLLAVPTAPADAFTCLQPDHFYQEAHRLIFAAAKALFERGEVIDIATLCLELRNREQYETVGEMRFLWSLAQMVPWSINVPRWAEIIRQEYLRRQVAATGEEMVRDADLEDAPEVILHGAQEKLLQLGQDALGSEGALLGSLLPAAIDDAQFRHDHRGDILGVPSGFKELDKLTAGFHPGDLVIVAGRPSMGKTSFALGLAATAASRKIRTIIFSLEMSREQLTQSLLCQEAGVDSQAWRNGLLASDDWVKLAEAIDRLSSYPLILDDAPSLTAVELRARALRHHHREPVGLVVVDYLQLLQGSSKRAADSRVQEISEITRALKGLARELNCPVVAAAQLNRAVEQRNEKRPQLSDLRESGEIEAAADLVLGLFRPHYYTRETPAATDTPDEAEVLILKQRNGPVGTVNLGFVPAWRRFVSIEPELAPAPSRRDWQ